MGAQFVCQRRQDRHVAISASFGANNVNLRWIAVQEQILDPDVYEFTYPCAGLEQGLDHEAVFALVAIGNLNQVLDLTLVQAGHGSFPGVRRLKPQPTPDPLDHVPRLIIAEMMLAPEAESLLNDKVQRMPDRSLTTQFDPLRAF
jgi:hypothetical protein